MMIQDPARPSSVDQDAAVRVLLTIDTELAWRSDSDRTDWKAVFERSYEAAGVGVAYQLRMLARHALKACFFVDPMPAYHFGIAPIRRMIEPILKAGQEVQLHLHPMWLGLIGDDNGSEQNLAGYDERAQQELIRRARDLLVEAGAPEPIAFRGGNFSANDGTLRSLARLGFRYDSSHNGDHHPWPSAIGLPSDHVTPILHEGVVEVPVTVIAEGQQLRHMQICAVSLAELKATAEFAATSGHPVINIVSHSFELANRAGTAPNKVHVRRFEGLCEWLSAERRRFPTSYFAELGDIPLDIPSTIRRPAGIRRVGRLIEQIWSNQIEERGN